MDKDMMTDAEFTEKVDVFRDHVDHLHQMIDTLPEPQKGFLGKAFQGFNIALEELQVAEEELRLQNDQLIAAQQELMVEHQHYLDLFELAPDGYLVTDEEGIIREANYAASTLLKQSQEQLIGKPLAIFIPNLERRIFHQWLSSLLQEKLSQVEELSIHPHHEQPVPVTITAAAFQDHSNGQLRLHWMLHDIRARVKARELLQQTNYRLRLLQEIASAANASNNIEALLKFALERICAHTRWPVGHVYLRYDLPNPLLLPTKIWHLDDPQKFAAFRQATERTRFAPGEGLSGRVLASRKPEWVPDVTREHGFVRLTIPEDRPVKAGLFFPVLAGQEVAAVMEFFSEEVLEPEAKLLELLGHIGEQLGRVFERVRAERQQREQQELLHNVISTAPVSIFMLDAQGKIRLSMGNSALHRQRLSEVIGKSVSEIYADFPTISENFQRALAGEAFSSVFEVEGIIFDTRYAPFTNEHGEINGVVGVAVDITENRRMVEALQKSEARFRMIFEDAALGIGLVDAQGNFVETNPALQEMLGHNAEELQQMNFSAVTHPDDVEKSRALFQELISGERVKYQMEKRYLHKNGNVIWTRVGVSLFRDEYQDLRYAIALVENVTAQKQIQDELAEVERRLIDSREAERLQLAQELHDGPVQDLLAISYQFNGLQEAFQDENGLLQFNQSYSMLQRVMRTLRGICGELRPPTLTPFGLEKAIRSHISQIEETRPDISIDLDLMNDGKSLPERMRQALYRIYQQAAINVIRHAKASQLFVQFRFDDDKVELTVKDNGKGFEVPERPVELVRQGHFGLVGSAERAQALGGNLRIESRPGQGTTLRVVVPRQEQEYLSTQGEGITLRY
jgi:PAS domain S-box-containing protein